MRGLVPPSRSSRRRFGGVSAAWWLTRWALVLLLAFDQFSSPFHTHAHDGAAGLGAFAAEHDKLDTGETHAHDGSHAQPSHALMAARSESSRWEQASQATESGPQFAVVPAVTAPAIAESAAPRGWPRGRSPPDCRTHRCLPPAGRAPPFHA